MIDERIGKRFHQRRMELGLTLEEIIMKTSLTKMYIQCIEQGATFMMFERLVILLNALETSADSVFFDEIKYPEKYRESILSKRIEKLSAEQQKLILDTVDALVTFAERSKE